MNDPRQATDLVTVELTTTLGALYRFPDVSRAGLEQVLPRLSTGVPAGNPSLALINASIASLVVPFRIIKRVVVDGEDWWIAPDQKS